MKTSSKNIKFLLFVICFISIFIDSRPSWATEWDEESGRADPRKQKGKIEVEREDSPLLGGSPVSRSPVSSSSSLQYLRSATELAGTRGTDTPPNARRLEMHAGTSSTIRVESEDDSSSGAEGKRPLLMPLDGEDSRRHSSSSSIQGHSMLQMGSELRSNMGQIYFQGHNQYDISSLIIYTITDQRVGTSWDNNSQFMSAMDAAFFNQERSWKVLGSGVLSALVGLSMPSTPATGSIMWGIGNALKIPISGGVSNTIVSEIMITMSPIFGRQFYTRGQIVMRALTCVQPYPPGHEDNRPHVIDPIFVHTALKFVVGTAALVEGAFYFGLAYVAEGQEFKGISLGMGPVLALAFAERYYTIGKRSLDHFFVRYYYDSAVVYQQREVLVEQAKRGLIEVAKNDRFVSEIYRIVQREMNVRENAELGDVGSQHYFALSALFLRHMVSKSEGDDVEPVAVPSQERGSSLLQDREDMTAEPQRFVLEDPDLSQDRAASDLREDIGADITLRRRNVGGNEGSPEDRENALLKQRIAELEKAAEAVESDNKKLQTFKALVDRMTPSAKEAFMDYLSIFLSGAGDFSRLLGRQYILELVLEQILSVDPVTSTNTAWCLAGADILIRNVLEYGTQKNQMRDWLNTLSLEHLVDFQFIRKGSGFFSFLNGGWFALANTVASIMNFQTMSVPLPLQIVCVIPAFVQDHAYISDYHKEQANEFFTDVATVKLLDCAGPPGIIRQRAWCHLWFKKLLRFLEVADTETIMVLFNKTQRAL